MSEDIEAIAARMKEAAAGAVPGPWKTKIPRGMRIARAIDGPENHTVAWCGHGNDVKAEATAKFIAACNPASVLAILADREALKNVLGKAQDYLSTWRSVFPDIAPDSVLPDRSKVEARVASLTALLGKARELAAQFACVCKTEICEIGCDHQAATCFARILLEEIEAALEGGKSPVGEKM